MCAGRCDPAHGPRAEKAGFKSRPGRDRIVEGRAVKLSGYFLCLSHCLLSPHALVVPAAGSGARQGVRTGSTNDVKLYFGPGTSRVSSPVDELQVFLLEAAVLLAISSRVLLQLRHPLLQEDHLRDGRGEDQSFMPKPAGKVTPSAGAAPTTSSASCRRSPLADSPRHSSRHHPHPALHHTKRPELHEPSLGLALGPPS